tara:strand:+ start:205 stop:420 length:216 start_codon:yes stop_codon:yes gene_type:complete
MYIVICINCNNPDLDLTRFHHLDWENIVYGLFNSKQEADDWSWKFCQKGYTNKVVKINDKDFSNGTKPWEQ